LAADRNQPRDEDAAFGLCDLGLGCPEIDYVSLSEPATVHGRLGLPVERGYHFEGDKPLSAYATDAHAVGRISTGLLSVGRPGR
jgi:hypothetical protein